jgi:hypothetical protein
MPGKLSIGDEVTEYLGVIADADELSAEIAEPLAISAPIAYALAGSTCRPGESAKDCRAYHALWQYLRLSNVTRTVRSDGPLFVAAASRRARAGRLRRVLICGTADYSMLAYLGHSARIAGVATSFDILDRCSTTLYLNDWYAKRVGLTARMICSDALSFQPDESYDLICTHSFLAWLDYHERPQIIKRWHDWLCEDGEVAFSNRIDPTDVTFPTRDRAERLEAITMKLFQGCEVMQVELPADRETLREMMKQFADGSLDRRRDMTMQRICGWLDDAGLVLDLAVPVADTVSSANDRASSPIKDEGRPRVLFLAHRL